MSPYAREFLREAVIVFSLIGFGFFVLTGGPFGALAGGLVISFIVGVLPIVLVLALIVKMVRYVAG